MSLSRRFTPAIALLLCGFALGAFSLTFTHLAGSRGGPGFEDATGSEARFHSAEGVAVDGAENVYVADTGNHTIRKITPWGLVTTLAGLAETPGSVDGHGANARFHSPRGLALDATGNLYVADTSNNTIRKITSDGVVTTIAGLPGNFGFQNGSGTAARFNGPRGLTVASDGFLYVADTGNHAIRRVSTAGAVTTFAGTGTFGNTNATGTAASFHSPQGVAFDPASGNLFVADTANHVVREVTLPGAVVTTFAGTMNVQGNDDGSPGILYNPTGICAHATTGTLYVTSPGTHTVRSITSAGSVGPISGVPYYPGPQDGGNLNGRLYEPKGLTIIGSTLFVADTRNQTIRKIALSPSDNIVTTLAGLAPVSGFTNATGDAARFGKVAGLAYYPGPTPGVAFVADPDNNAIRRILLSDGSVTTLAGGTYGYANGASAAFRNPQGVAADPGSSGVFVADTGNHVIRFVNGLGTTSLVAGQPSISGNMNGDALTEASFNAPRDVAYRDPYIYVADTGNRLVRRIHWSSGNVLTLAGSGAYGASDGVGTAASFGVLTGITVDIDDNVYVAESLSGTIRMIEPDGTVTTVAGNSIPTGAADGIGTNARFGYPGPADISSNGFTYIADPNAHLIRAMTLDGFNVTTAGGKAGLRGTSPGTGSFARFDGASQVVGSIVSEGFRVRWGEPEIADRATIDSPTGAVNAARQLDALPANATTWHWEVIRRPAGSTAALSSTSIRNPTFTPDVADLYVFRVTARNSTGVSISTTHLQASGTAAALSGGYPGPKAPGLAFLHTITAFDLYGVRADGYAGTVQFTSSDPSATLPSNYTYTGTDAGQHTFSVTLHTFGMQSVTVTDIANPSLTTTMVFSVELYPPYNLQATATTATNVNLTWFASPGATGYEIQRRSSDGGGWLALTSVAGTSHGDSTALASRAYAYRVRATHPSAPAPSAFSGPDVATTFPFTNDPVVAGMLVRAVHITELRNAANALRAAAGLTAFSFTDPVLSTSTPIRAVHITQLRTAINQGRNSLGMGSFSFTDPTLTPPTPVRAIHINQLRTALK